VNSRGGCCFLVLLKCRDLFYTLYPLNFPINKNHKLLNRGKVGTTDHDLLHDHGKPRAVLPNLHMLQYLTGKHSAALLLSLGWQKEHRILFTYLAALTVGPLSLKISHILLRSLIAHKTPTFRHEQEVRGKVFSFLHSKYDFSVKSLLYERKTRSRWNRSLIVDQLLHNVLAEDSSYKHFFP
jgi:hypothetical protein